MEFPTIDKFVKDVAEKALDEFIYEGKTIREWVEIIIKQQPCDDAIGREKVFEQISCWVNSGEYRYTNATYYLTRRIRGISSVTPQQKIGKWIDVDSLDGALWHDCSECGETEFYATDYCPNCGAKMEVEE